MFSGTARKLEEFFGLKPCKSESNDPCGASWKRLSCLLSGARSALVSEPLEMGKPLAGLLVPLLLPVVRFPFHNVGCTITSAAGLNKFCLATMSGLLFLWQIATVVREPWNYTDPDPRIRFEGVFKLYYVKTYCIRSLFSGCSPNFEWLPSNSS